MNDARCPWGRRDDESEEAYLAFLKYRDQGPRRRLVQILTPARGQSGGNERAIPGRIGKWSSEHGWVDRATAWDDHIQAEMDKYAAKEARKWERRRQKALEANWEMSQRIRAKVDKMLAFPIREEEAEKDGKTIVIKPARWTFQSAAMMAKLASEIEAAVLFAAGKDLDELSDVEVWAIASDIGVEE